MRVIADPRRGPDADEVGTTATIVVAVVGVAIVLVLGGVAWGAWHYFAAAMGRD